MSSLLVSAVSAWTLLYAPGLALVRRGASTLPVPFRRVLVSAATTTIAATGLAAAERFSLGSLLAVNAALLVPLFLAGRRLREPSRLRPERDFIGPALVAAALVWYWPAYPAFLHASDSTAYLTTGISLARHGTLARDDELGPRLPRPVREVLFDSMSQVFWDAGPPYRRVPGALMIESLDATRAWSCFFPVPSVWAAISAVRSGTLREQAGADHAPLFASLALWAFWHLARTWIGARWALLASLLLGLSGPWTIAAHLPMSEPIAAYFALGGLAVLASSPRAITRSDAVVAGVALGAAVFTRIEVALFLALAWALAPALRPHDESSPTRPLFLAVLAAVASLTIVEALLLPGMYVLPFFDQVENAWINYQLRFGAPGAGLVLAAAAGVLAFVAALVRTFGLSATIRWGLVTGVLAGHWAASNFLAERTPMWLSFYIGWSGLALSGIGFLLAARDRQGLAGSGFPLALAAGVSLVLFYNPHVYPALPWGARRFVPLLLPLLVLLGSYASRTAWHRSRLLGLACIAAIAWPVVQGGKPLWRERFLDPSWEQLQEVSRAIPDDGIVLVDREISRTMLAPSLWLVLDRNNITVPPISDSYGQKFFPPLVWELTTTKPVYYVTRGTGDHLQPPRVAMTRIASPILRTRYIESTYSRRPERTVSVLAPLAVYRLQRGLLTRPQIVR